MLLYNSLSMKERGDFSFEYALKKEAEALQAGAAVAKATFEPVVKALVPIMVYYAGRALREPIQKVSHNIAQMQYGRKPVILFKHNI